uniref:Secreted protein n=1 Tax=Bionectria ochroleuca TaxID=29856 RepID=A0A0B7K0V7_BIOOC
MLIPGHIGRVLVMIAWLNCGAVQRSTPFLSAEGIASLVRCCQWNNAYIQTYQRRQYSRCSTGPRSVVDKAGLWLSNQE